MKYILSLITCVCLTQLIACKESSSRKSSETLGPSTTNTTQEPTNPASGNQPTLQQPATNTVGLMNPEHGKPGHRCDLPVGAPLNNTPPSTQNISTTIPPNTTAPTPTLQTQSPLTNVGTGLNPAHGQPGHRCDIAVGAPLNNKPKQ